MNIRKLITKRIVVAAAAAIAVASVALPGATGVFESAPVSASGVDNAIFLGIEGIDGSVNDRGYEGSIKLLSVSQSITRPTGGSAGSVRVRSGAIFGDFVVEKEVDASTPKLQEAIATGKLFPKVKIQMTTSYGASRQAYLIWELTNVRVTSYNISGSADGGALPTEEITLNYEGYTVVHTDRAPDGSSKGNVEFTWNIQEGAK